MQYVGLEQSGFFAPFDRMSQKLSRIGTNLMAERQLRQQMEETKAARARQDKFDAVALPLQQEQLAEVQRNSRVRKDTSLMESSLSGLDPGMRGTMFGGLRPDQRSQLLEGFRKSFPETGHLLPEIWNKSAPNFAAPPTAPAGLVPTGAKTKDPLTGAETEYGRPLPSPETMNQGLPEGVQFIMGPDGKYHLDKSGQEADLRHQDNINKFVEKFEAHPEVVKYRASKAASDVLQGLVEASRKNPSGAMDTSMIYNFMKTLDPASTVREGEVQMAQNTAPVVQGLWQKYQQFAKGEKLLPKQREDFLKSAMTAMTSMRKSAESAQSDMLAKAKRFGLDPDEVRDYVSLDAPGEAAAEAPAQFRTAAEVEAAGAAGKLQPGAVVEVWDQNSGQWKKGKWTPPAATAPGSPVPQEAPAPAALGLTLTPEQIRKLLTIRSLPAATGASPTPSLALPPRFRPSARLN